ncbi:MAG TPA: exonuclease SbcCD subunit D [Thermoplasmataceae archaeon]|nr:exonuclease SbcCD subunit D [Thermoplasmatales archaeon AK]HLH86677.1 exonuclease SbcCD subunit D [Thermoplasmataceae archaeon]
MRFMHLSDTHLGSRQYLMPEREQDFYDAFSESVDIAIREHVDFVVHSGDLFDRWDPSNMAIARFRDGLLRLWQTGIPFFMVLGDHDRPKRLDMPAGEIFDFIGLKLLGVDGAEPTIFSKDGEEVLIVGLSNMKGLDAGKVKEEYSKADSLASSSTNSILISHQAIEGYLYDDAIEVRRTDLPGNFSYLAFGHIHNYSIEPEKRPVLSYAGSTELKSENEIQGFLSFGKGVNIVSLAHGDVEVKRVALRSVRFQYSLETTQDKLNSELDRVSDVYSARFGDKKPLIHVNVLGESDREIVDAILKKHSEFLYTPVTYSPPDSPQLPIIGRRNRYQFIEEYFKDDPETGRLAVDYLRSFENGDHEKWIEEQFFSEVNGNETD